MYVVELAFGSHPERLAARPAHRQRLHREGVLFAAGPFDDDSGALLIFDVQDTQALDSLLAEDPYFHTAGVTVMRAQS